MSAELQDLAVDIAGFQEARSGKSFFQSQHFLHLRSGAKGDHFGCEVWIAKSFSVPGSIKRFNVSMTGDHLTVVIACPRISLVSMFAPVIKANILVVHAPWCSRSPTEEVRNKVTKFWIDLDAALAKVNTIFLGPLFCLSIPTPELDLCYPHPLAHLLLMLKTFNVCFYTNFCASLISFSHKLSSIFMTHLGATPCKRMGHGIAVILLHFPCRGCPGL